MKKEYKIQLVSMGKILHYTIHAEGMIIHNHVYEFWITDTDGFKTDIAWFPIGQTLITAVNPIGQ
jgi:hypothetical protein